MIWKFALHLLSRAEIFSKIKQFSWSDVTIELPLLSQGKLFHKNKAVLLMRLENLDYPIITTWNVHERKTIFIQSLESFNCPYYHELKFSKKYGWFYEITWKFALPLTSRGQIFTKIKQFCWSELKIWTAPIITSWSFLKNMAEFIKLLESSRFPYHHEVKFSQQQSSFVEVTWKFELPLLSRAKIF